jgi:hypothetical protein
MIPGDRPPGITARTGYSVQSATMCRPPLTASSRHVCQLELSKHNVQMLALPHHRLLHGLLLHGCCTQKGLSPLKSQVTATKSSSPRCRAKVNQHNLVTSQNERTPLLNGLFHLTAVDRWLPVFAGAYGTVVGRAAMLPRPRTDSVCPDQGRDARRLHVIDDGHRVRLVLNRGRRGSPGARLRTDNRLGP